MKKILLVNNREAFLDRNKSLLNRAGFRVLTATCAEEAMRSCRDQAVDLIISLLDLPETGGDLLCSQLRRERGLRGLPVILVCYATEAEMKRASNCGANVVLTKPVRPELLLEQTVRFLKMPARRNHRAAFRARVNGARESSPLSGMILNISTSGILCETVMPLNQDDLVTGLLLDLDAGRIIADGRVVWSESMPDGRCNSGVQFTSLAPESRERIERFVASSEQLQMTG